MSIFDTPASQPAVDNQPIASGAGPGPTTPGVADNTTVVTPADAGTSQPVAGDSGTASGEAAKYLSLDDYGDYLVKVKVDGVEKELPLNKVRDGLMMQEAFTKRTQELAQERRALHQANSLMAALEADPRGTLAQLAEAYDLDPTAGLSPVQREPDEQRMIDRERYLARQEQQLQQQRVQYEINRLINDFGVSETDLPQLADAAIRMGTDLETAYKVLTFESMRNNPPATSQPQVDQARRQQALDAQAVHSGASTQRGAVIEPPAKIDSIHDAWEASKRELRAAGINV